jgi:hypothetical protein
LSGSCIFAFIPFATVSASTDWQAKWTAYSTPSTSTLSAIWGSDSTHVWAADRAGTIVRWDGTQWSASATLTSSRIASLHGCSATDIWAANDAGVPAILHYFDGTSWHDSDPGIGEISVVPAVQCLAPNDVWYISDQAILRRQTP